MSDTPILDKLAAQPPLLLGCGDSSCLVRPPSAGPGRYGGQHTNGGCRCFGGGTPARVIHEAALVIDALVVEADSLRAERGLTREQRDAWIKTGLDLEQAWAEIERLRSVCSALRHAL